MQQERESAELCANGCGFFGAPASGGMCSVCWKKTMSKRAVDNSATSAGASPAKSDAPRAETADAGNNNNNNDVAVAGSVEVATPAGAAGEEKEPAKSVQKNKNRCWECKKKVGLTAIECRCGYVFCSNHRYADQHSCSFDFKAADRAELARRNPGGGQFGKLEKL
ncbi:Zinc-finger containing protein, partial [Globisporangium splendens]